ncbi:unnamed protein product [Calypogeia fissa]
MGKGADFETPYYYTERPKLHPYLLSALPAIFNVGSPMIESGQKPGHSGSRVQSSFFARHVLGSSRTKELGSKAGQRGNGWDADSPSGSPMSPKRHTVNSDALGRAYTYYIPSNKAGSK